MKSVKMTIAPILLALSLMTLTLFGSSVAEAHAKTPVSGCNAWTVTPTPNPGAQNVFDGVAAISQSDVWAVGYTDNQPLTAHWDGTSWSAVPNPVISGQNFLFAATAISTNDVWAVGQNNSQVLTEQWNGTAWNVVPAPTVGTSSIFQSVAAIPGGSNVWAVGHSNNGGNDQTLIELWNGSSWNIVTSPNIGAGSNDLLGVVAVSANDAWAVGTHATNKGIYQTLTEQWNGTSWKVVNSPNVSNNGVLWAAAPIPDGKQIWAAGTYQKNGNNNLNLIEQRSEESWNVVHSQNVSGINNTLFGITALSARDAWAVGLLYQNSGSNQALTEHWNGTSWSVFYTPNVQGDSILTAATRVPATKIAWAVGVSYDGSGNSYTIAQSICL